MVSDVFPIQCWNGDRVPVAFSLDTCDREAIRYVAFTRGVDGALVRDLMVERVEARFGSIARLTTPVPWLSGNGPCFVVGDTVTFGRRLGMDICTTPVYSPESNGMAQAFVKTFKRDDTWVADLSSASVLMGQLSGWFEDYNEHAPHKGLGMQSPRQYRRTVHRMKPDANVI